MRYGINVLILAWFIAAVLIAQTNLSPTAVSIKKADRAYGGHAYGVPYMSDGFMEWAATRKYNAIVIGSGYSDFVLSVYRHTNNPFVWDDGSHGDTEQIRVVAPQSKLHEAEQAIQELDKKNVFSIYRQNKDGSVSQNLYYLEPDGSVAMKVEQLEWTTPSYRKAQAQRMRALKERMKALEERQ